MLQLLTNNLVRFCGVGSFLELRKGLLNNLVLCVFAVCMYAWSEFFVSSGSITAIIA